MTTVNNQLQLMNMFTQTASTFGGDFGQYLNTGLSSVNCLWEIVEGRETGNACEMTAGINGLANLFISVLSMIASPEQKAENDVQETNKKIEDGSKKIEEVKRASNQKIQEIIDKMNDEANKVKSSIDKLEEIVGNDGTLTNAQKELEAKKEEIEKQKAILNDPESSIEDKKEALVQLSNISLAIRGLAEQMAALQTVVAAETAKVEAATVKIDALSAQGQQEVSTSLADAGAIVAQTSQGTLVSVTRQTAEGNAEEITGASLVESGGALSATGVGSAIGSEMIDEGIKFIDAGKTHLIGSATNMAKFGEAVGKWGGDFTTIGYDMQLLGLANTSALGLIGSYGLKASAAIESIGSWTSVIATVSELDEAIGTYAQAIDVDVVHDEENSENTTNDETNSLFANEKTSLFEAKPNTQSENKQHLNPLYKVINNKFSKWSNTKYKEINTKSQEEIKDVKFEFETSKFKITPFSLKKQK